jgi:hemin uptake protein HemP
MTHSPVTGHACAQDTDIPRAGNFRAHASVSAVPQNPVSSHDLLQGQTELQILHNGEIYRLRITSKNKLILTK